MGHQSAQSAGVWALAKSQHGVVARAQLLELGLNADAIQHRIQRGRLHPIFRGVYAVGRPEITRHGRWIAAVLSYAAGAILSHASAAALWRICQVEGARVEVSVPAGRSARRAGVIVHRRSALASHEWMFHEGIPLTAPACTLVDIAVRVDRPELEAAINEANRLDLIVPQSLREYLDETPRRPGIAVVRETLDRRTFALTDSELERRFLRLVRDAGLPRPLTQQRVNGFRVDFFWPDLGLVVETDGLRYHRTPAQQARDRLRDQAHTAAGLTPLRFTHAQIRYEPGQVGGTLAATIARLRAAGDDRAVD